MSNNKIVIPFIPWKNGDYAYFENDLIIIVGVPFFSDKKSFISGEFQVFSTAYNLIKKVSYSDIYPQKM